MSSFIFSVLNCANANSGPYVLFNFSNRYLWSLYWNSDAILFSPKHVWMLTQINFYYLHLFWNISLRCWLWDSGKYFFIMPIFIIKMNVLQHKRKIIRRFNIGSCCLNLCISLWKVIDVRQKDQNWARVVFALSYSWSPRKKSYFLKILNSEISTVPVSAPR